MDVVVTIRDTLTGVECSPQKGALPGGFVHEGGTYEVKAVWPEYIAPCLELSDEVLSPHQISRSPDCTCATWFWQVEHYAGEVSLSLNVAEGSVGEYLLDVSPHPRKLGREHHEEMLAQLQEMAEGCLFGMMPAQVGLQQQHAETPPIAYYALFRAFAHPLREAFAAIMRSPHRRLHSIRETVPVHKVRRCDSRTLRRAVLNQWTAQSLRSRSAVTARKTLFDVPQAIQIHDTPPNRYILHLLDRLAARVQLVENALNLQAGDTVHPNRMQTWASRMNSIRRNLRQMRRSSTFEYIKPAAPDVSALITMAHEPAYARFGQLAHFLLTPGVLLGNDPRLSLPLRPTYELYEYWCFFRLLGLLQECLPGATWTNQFELKQGGLLNALPDGSKVEGRRGDTCVRLTYQRRFTEATSPCSISGDWVPDYALEVRRNNATTLIILDAKYRSSGESIKEGIRDMHVYRDAIRESRTQSGITAAYVLVPAHGQDVAYFFDEEYRQTHGLGGYTLTPSTVGDTPDLRHMITALVGEPDAQ